MHQLDVEALGGCLLAFFDNFNKPFVVIGNNVAMVVLRNEVDMGATAGLLEQVQLIGRLCHKCTFNQVIKVILFTSCGLCGGVLFGVEFCRLDWLNR